MGRRELKSEIGRLSIDQSKGKGLDEILGIVDRDEFILTLRHYLMPPGIAMTWQDVIRIVPEPARIVLVVDIFATAISSGGMAKFVCDYNDLINPLKHFLKLLDAHRSLEYLQQANSCFEAGEIPSDPDEYSIMSKKSESCLRELDAKFSQAILDELPRVLRAYARTNPEDLEGARVTGLPAPPCGSCS